MLFGQRAEASTQRIGFKSGEPQNGRSNRSIQLQRIIFLQELVQQNTSLFANAHDLGADAGFADMFDLDSTTQESVGVQLAFEIQDLPNSELLVADNEKPLTAEVLQQTGDRGTADQ
jgi:hypothetical protein